MKVTASVGGRFFLICCASHRAVARPATLVSPTSSPTPPSDTPFLLAPPSPSHRNSQHLFPLHPFQPFATGRRGAISTLRLLACAKLPKLSSSWKATHRWVARFTCRPQKPRARASGQRTSPQFRRREKPTSSNHPSTIFTPCAPRIDFLWCRSALVPVEKPLRSTTGVPVP